MLGAMRAISGTVRWGRGIVANALACSGAWHQNGAVAEGQKYEITVSVRAAYRPEQSDEAGGRYVFSYTVRIRNTGSVGAQLRARHWVITDAQDRVQEVRGPGVVGEQPTLRPGESYEYSSGTAIATPVGTMRGSYEMLAEEGTVFHAPIPQFTLSVPRVLH
jgi:ApaG protein